MTVDPQPINLFEFEATAEQVLPKHEFDYIVGGATDEISLKRNRQAYDAIALRPRVLTDVSELDLSTTVLGTEVSLPVLIATVRWSQESASRWRDCHVQGHDRMRHDSERQRKFERVVRRAGRCRERTSVAPALSVSGSRADNPLARASVQRRIFRRVRHSRLPVATQT